MKEETISTPQENTGTYLDSLEKAMPPCLANPQKNGIHIWKYDTGLTGFTYKCVLCSFKVN